MMVPLRSPKQLPLAINSSMTIRPKHRMKPFLIAGGLPQSLQPNLDSLPPELILTIGDSLCGPETDANFGALLGLRQTCRFLYEIITPLFGRIAFRILTVVLSSPRLKKLEYVSRHPLFRHIVEIVDVVDAFDWNEWPCDQCMKCFGNPRCYSIGRSCVQTPSQWDEGQIASSLARVRRLLDECVPRLSGLKDINFKSSRGREWEDCFISDVDNEISPIMARSPLTQAMLLVVSTVVKAESTGMRIKKISTSDWFSGLSRWTQTRKDYVGVDVFQLISVHPRLLESLEELELCPMNELTIQALASPTIRSY